MEQKAIVTLSAQELMEMERIIIDGEKEEALRFLKKIRKQIEDSRKSSCKNEHL